jgi:thiol-disulfide isomerase/thioredoxin
VATSPPSASTADVKLSSFKGKPVLISFWTGARAPADDVAKLAAAYKDQGLAVWAINVATERAEFDTWAKANAAALGYTVSWDPAGKAVMESIVLHEASASACIPAYVALDAEGRFRGGIIGMGPKVAAWVRLSIDRAGIKLGAEDRAAVEATLREHFAANPPAGMAAATIQAQGQRRRHGCGPARDHARPRRRRAGLRDARRHGKEVRLSDFKGKVVILDFWATWCGPCIASMPHTQKLAAAYKDQGVVVLASGTSDTIAKFKEWIPKNQPKYPDLRLHLRPARARLRHVQRPRLVQALRRDRHPDAVRHRPRRQDRRHHRRQRRRVRRPHRGRAGQGRRQGGRRAAAEGEKQLLQAAAEEAKPNAPPPLPRRNSRIPSRSSARATAS